MSKPNMCRKGGYWAEKGAATHLEGFFHFAKDGVGLFQGLAESISAVHFKAQLWPIALLHLTNELYQFII